MNSEYRYEKCRLKSRLHEMLKKYSNLGYRLKSVTMGDLATRFELIFEKNSNSSIKYIYAHEQSRFASKVEKYLNAYSSTEWSIAFHVMGDMATRHELFFEKQEVQS